MPKDTCWAVVMSNREKIKPVSLAVIESEGIRQAGGWVGEQADMRAGGQVGRWAGGWEGRQASRQ